MLFRRRKKRVLVLDDDVAMQKLVATLLRRDGHRVDVVDSGNEAIAALGRTRYDAILLDLMMPHEGGMTVIQHLREKNPELLKKVVILTATPAPVLKSVEPEVFAIVHKPFDRDSLRRTVKALVLRRPKMRLTLLEGRYAVCRMGAREAIPEWADGPGFVSITRTDDELSIVAPEQRVPAAVPAERGWRCMSVAGPIAFDVTGVTPALTAPLAEAGVSLLLIATHDTDYLLVRETELATAITALEHARHTVDQPPAAASARR